MPVARLWPAHPPRSPARRPAPSRLAALPGFLAAEFRMLGPAGTLLVLARAALQAAAGATTAVSLAAFAPILAAAAHGRVAWAALALWAGAQFLASAVNAADPLLLHLQDHALSTRRHADLLRRVSALPYAAFLDPAGIDALDRARRAAGGASDAYTAVIDHLNTLSRTLSLAVLLWGFSPWLPFTTALAVLPLARTRWKTAGDLHALDNAETVHRRRAGYLAGRQFDRRSQAELRLLGADPLVLRRWRRAIRRSDRVVLRATRAGLQQSLPPLLAAGGALAANGCLLYGLLLGRRLPAPDLVPAVLAVLSATTAWARVVEDIAGLRGSVLRLRDHHRLPALDAPAPARVRALPPAAIRLEGVSYRYPGAAGTALRDVSCTITAGEHVALVGANGSGKTTLAMVLLGLHRPATGTMTRQAEAPGVILQGFTRYRLSATANVAIGAAGRGRVRRADLLRAADRAGLTPAVSGLPHGWATRLDEGTDLSGGQWQRLGLARALIGGRGLWVFDEPTSALDPLAELALAEALGEAVGSHALLVISHRLGITRLVDRVVVLEHGRIVQDGPPGELALTEGPFREMYTAQAEWYR